MSNIYNVAAGMEYAKPVTSFIEGQNAAIDQKSSRLVNEQRENANETYDAEAPLREQTREAQSQTLRLNQITERLSFTKDLYENIVDESSFQASRDAIAQEFGAESVKHLSGTYAENKDEIQEALGTGDEFLGSIKQLEEWRTLAEDETNPNRDAYQKAIDAKTAATVAQAELQALERQAKMAEIDAEGAGAEKDRAAAQASRANARQTDVETDNLTNGLSKDGKPLTVDGEAAPEAWKPKQQEINDISSLAAEYYGELYDPDTKKFLITDPDVVKKVNKIRERATQLFMQYRGKQPTSLVYNEALIQLGLIDPANPKKDDPVFIGENQFKFTGEVRERNGVEVKLYAPIREGETYGTGLAVGEVVESGGRKMKVVGYMDDGMPLMDEI